MVDCASRDHTKSVVQAMLESTRLAPHPSNPQDVLCTWQALRSLPAQLDFAIQLLDQELVQIHMDRQPSMRASADAIAEVMGCLDQLEGDAKADSIVAESMRAVLLEAADELKVSGLCV